MPYVVRGNTVYKKNGKKLTKKATAKSKSRAKAMVRLLYAVEGGYELNTKKPKGKKRGKK
jgi:hypothetical protein